MSFGEVPHVVSHELTGKVADGWAVLDVRTDEEWDEGRIDGAVHIPMHEVVARLAEVPDQVVCVCAVGARSSRVAQYLIAQGKDAVNLDGGVQAWADSGRPLIR